MKKLIMVADFCFILKVVFIIHPWFHWWKLFFNVKLKIGRPLAAYQSAVMLQDLTLSTCNILSSIMTAQVYNQSVSCSKKWRLFSPNLDLISMHILDAFWLTHQSFVLSLILDNFYYYLIINKKCPYVSQKQAKYYLLGSSACIHSIKLHCFENCTGFFQKQNLSKHSKTIPKT